VLFFWCKNITAQHLGQRKIVRFLPFANISIYVMPYFYLPWRDCVSKMTSILFCEYFYQKLTDFY